MTHLGISALPMIMRSQPKFLAIDLFADTAAILISVSNRYYGMPKGQIHINCPLIRRPSNDCRIVSNRYYGMPKGQIHINLPPEYPIMSVGTIEIKMAAVSAKRSMQEHRLEIWRILNSEGGGQTLHLYCQSEKESTSIQIPLFLIGFDNSCPGKIHSEKNRYPTSCHDVL